MRAEASVLSVGADAKRHLETVVERINIANQDMMLGRCMFHFPADSGVMSSVL